MNIKLPVSIEQEELRGFSRSMAELEWLILLLVLLTYSVPDLLPNKPDQVVVALVVFALFIIVFRYFNFYERETHWKLAIESWVMISFITYVLWYTGKLESPLLNIYLLVIISSALSLGKLITLLEVALITCAYLYMAYTVHSTDIFSLSMFSVLMSKFSPFLLVAYITTMLSADINYAKGLFKTASETDELTGLMNIRAFNSALEQELQRSRRYARDLTVMMVDADNLKPVNDRLGHEAGNQLIRMLATTIQAGLRSSDMLARYGGDEFTILLQETSGPRAVEAGERIRIAVQNTSVDVESNRVGATVSIGIASFPNDGDNVHDLMHKADLALYQSKRCGRNRLTVYSDSIKEEKNGGKEPSR